MTLLFELSLHIFNDKQSLAQAVADELAESAKDGGTIALAGGETPKPAYQLLAQKTLPWHKLEFFATDERCVSSDDPRSNEKMLRDILGAQAKVLTLKENTPAPKADTALLGMGADGHIASLFPGAMPETDETLIRRVSPQSMPEERLTLPLTFFTEVRRLLIMTTGKEKWQVLLSAAENEESALPVAALLKTRKKDTEVFHAP